MRAHNYANDLDVPDPLIVSIFALIVRREQKAHHMASTQSGILSQLR